MKYINIFFGEMGSGKSYLGHHMAENLNFSFFEGDSVVPPEMAAKVAKFQPLTREIIETYVYNYLLPAIIEQADKVERGLVVAQALYTEFDRVEIKRTLQALGFQVAFFYVKAPFWRNLKQLWSRPQGFRWILYWLMNKPFFQKPLVIKCLTIGTG